MNRKELLEKSKSIPIRIELLNAILNGESNKLIKLVRPQPLFKTARKYIVPDNAPKRFQDCDDFEYEASRYKVGDYLAVKESFLLGDIEAGYESPNENEYTIFNTDKNGKVIYCVDHILNSDLNNILKSKDWESPKWTPSIHMPKEYSRLFLKITNVRIEKLKDLSLKDYSSWHLSLNNECDWEYNPFVFLYEFELISFSQSINKLYKRVS